MSVHDHHSLSENTYVHKCTFTSDSDIHLMYQVLPLSTYMYNNVGPLSIQCTCCLLFLEERNFGKKSSRSRGASQEEGRTTEKKTVSHP